MSPLSIVGRHQWSNRMEATCACCPFASVFIISFLRTCAYITSVKQPVAFTRQCFLKGPCAIWASVLSNCQSREKQLSRQLSFSSDANCTGARTARSSRVVVVAISINHKCYVFTTSVIGSEVCTHAWNGLLSDKTVVKLTRDQGHQRH